MSNGKMAMARLAIEQLNRKDRLSLVRDLGLVPEASKEESTIEARLLRRREVASRLSVSLRTVDNWAREGLLTKRRLPGRRRAAGFSSVDVEKLIGHSEPQG